MCVCVWCKNRYLEFILLNLPDEFFELLDSDWLFSLWFIIDAGGVIFPFISELTLNLPNIYSLLYLYTHEY